MTDDEALRYLSGNDVARAEDAFDWLVRNHHNSLVRSLCRAGLLLQDAEDALQDTLRKHWNNRTNFQNTGIASWIKYIRVGAIRAFLDAREPHPPLPLDEQQIPPEERPLLESLYVAILTQRIFVCADALWLQADPTIDTREWERQLLAATLYYMDGADLQDILEILRVSDHSAKTTLTQIQRWLVSPALLLRLAYQNLYFSNRELIIFLQQNISLDETEQEVVDWHFQRGLSPTMIPSHLKAKATTKESVVALLQTICLQLPFGRRMQNLLDSLENRSDEDILEHFVKPGLWKRLVFQYHYRDDLNPDCIMERVEPAAKTVPFPISADKVNIWTYGGRLRNSLVKYWKVYFEGEFHDAH